MKQEEYQKLLKAHGKEKTDEMLDKLNNYKGSTGKTYKSDYLTILNWVREWAAKKQPTRQGVVFHGFDEKKETA